MSSNTTTATAVVAHAANDLRVEAIEVATPAAHEAQIAIAYGGICGSDLHYWSHGAAGESILKAPMVLGHEIVGTVTAAAADGTGPAAGTMVAVHPATPGGTGARYPQERPNLSPGCTYLGSAARYPHTEGAFATTVNLPARMLRALPAGLSLRDAALAEPAAVAWHAVARAGEVAGKRVMVIGAGPIGALAVAVLKRAGAAEIIAVDMFDRPLEIAAAAGATATLKADDVDAIAAVEADVVIEASGNHHGLASAVRGAVRGGRIVMVGLLPSGEQPALISLAITRELELVGSFRFNDEIDDVLAALADGTLEVSAVVTHEFGVDDALEAFAVARNSAESGKVLLRFTAEG
ncbi:L-idonate 5-dehydrogenase [Arthrobacter sp. UCD-GKA]|uniref:L-idonate 5-dehydrogenase n=1 Tax=Arthrobacter sp. UCD-GKA TaxID=1913576 RepID=UPI0008DE09E8|nr:L-idonate 5-dehydrogenase [Arthrobacter sp. UCD-GKA]OIH83837.1 L-idonate 5-dehydrogenase [Arthrobacter sp. UCD-GKA]